MYSCRCESHEQMNPGFEVCTTTADSSGFCHFPEDVAGCWLQISGIPH